MSSGKKRKSFGGFGFLTALEFMDEDDNDNTVAARRDNDEENGSNNTRSKQQTVVAKAKDTDTALPFPSTDRHVFAPDQSSFVINLTVRGLQFYKENVQSIDIESIILLQRQPDNEHDENAIAAYHGHGTQKQQVVGHVAREQAAILASLMDENIIKVDHGLVKDQTDATLSIAVGVSLLKEDKRDDFETLYHRISAMTDKTKTHAKRSSIIDEEAVEEYAAGITKQDSETAATCTIDICQQPSLPWKKNEDGSAASWPPDPEILEAMSVGCAHDEAWWQENAGLKPPSQWNVQGAIDLLPKLFMSRDQKARASDVLDDAVHGVTNVWSDETLEGMRELMDSERFWNHRGADAFIRSFGGPYVLGQEEGKLKLIKGSPHTPLTEKICHGHNLVYEMIHFEKPPGPGFNTIIFGLNLRRSGFHYHQDTIASLQPKNEPMIRNQPVVTTVYYQLPEIDNGKELVLWKPLLNFKPKGDSLYLAARGIRTIHGMIHVQRAGLQGHAQHGIFHTPIFSKDEKDDNEPIVSSDPRRGYRVAITARITYPDSEKRLEPFIKNSHYQKIIGPNGLTSLALA
mmetsp:Transcript_19284/g.30175  ORF Transcript_19284/g.30175 Transcript_19284/m.30175 type:complete len:573 (-) Transcript_19284:348-2066(-)